MRRYLSPWMLAISTFTGAAFAQSSADPTFVPPEIEAALTILRSGEFDRAYETVRDSLPTWEDRYGQDSFPVAWALDVLGFAAARGQHVGDVFARDSTQRAARIKEELLGATHPELGRSLFVLGTVLQKRGEPEAAIEPLRRSVEIYRDAMDGDAEETARSLNMLGGSLAAVGKLRESLPSFEEALAIRTRLYGADHPVVAQSYGNIGQIKLALGDVEGAIHCSESAVRIAEESAGPRSPDLVYHLNPLATLRLLQGDLRAARADHERALSIVEEHWGAEHPTAAAHWEGLGKIAQRLGQYERATECFRRALEIASQSKGDEHPDLANYLLSLAEVHQALGDLETASAMASQGMALRERLLDADHPSLARGRLVLADVLLARGELDLAAAQLETALPVLESNLEENHHSLATGLTLLGTVEAQRGRVQEAMAHLDRALRVTEEGFGDRREIAVVLGRRARLRFLSGDHEAAMADALRAEAMMRHQVRLVIQTLSERVAGRFNEVRENSIDLSVSILAESEMDAGPVWDSVIRSRGLLLDELSARRRAVRANSDPESDELARELFRARSRMADLYVRGPADGDVTQYRGAFEQAREAKEAAERALSERSAEFRRHQQARSVGLDEVVGALPEAAKLVAFLRYERFSTDAPPHARYGAFVLEAGRVRFVDLGEAEAIDQLIDRWRRGLESGAVPSGPLAEQAERQARGVGELLRERVWDPLQLQAAGLILVVPDAQLHLLPLAALPTGDSRFLIESGFRFHYLSSEKSLLRTADPPATGLLALGNPAFDDLLPAAPDHRASITDERLVGVLRGVPPGCERFRSMDFLTLSGTREECSNLAELWRSFGRDGVTLLQGADASETEFKTRAPGRRIIHLATHGYFLGSSCNDEDAAESKDPLLLSGLALAGANRRQEAEANTDDGILTAEEISILDLGGTEWTVLSACDTGMGTIVPGEGVYGLRRAFETAGARTVIMSLWPVDDQNTRNWMNALYAAHLAEGLNTAESVNVASLQLLNRQREAGFSVHPFWWAGFVAAGDWR